MLILSNAKAKRLEPWLQSLKATTITSLMLKIITQTVQQNYTRIPQMSWKKINKRMQEKLYCSSMYVWLCGLHEILTPACKRNSTPPDKLNCSPPMSLLSDTQDKWVGRVAETSRFGSLGEIRTTIFPQIQSGSCIKPNLKLNLGQLTQIENPSLDLNPGDCEPWN